MTPTLIGRIQSRLILVLLVGIPWTILVGPFLPAGQAPLIDVYQMTFTAVILVAIIGAVVWEPLYHLAQQYRWEKDWPTGLGLITALPEGLLVYRLLGTDVPVAAFVWHFLTTWLLVWFVLNGPIRVLLPRWRFRGGRLL